MIYAPRENLNPGINSSVVTQPPTRFLRSRTHTFHPARARYNDVIRPLCPAPMIMASHLPIFKYNLAVVFKFTHLLVSGLGKHPRAE